jgi:hypothetical protein
MTDGRSAGFRFRGPFLILRYFDSRSRNPSISQFSGWGEDLTGAILGLLDQLRVGSDRPAPIALFYSFPRDLDLTEWEAEAVFR